MGRRSFRIGGSLPFLAALAVLVAVRTGDRGS
jgi:hypothetical protein